MRPKIVSFLVLFFGIVGSLNCWALPMSLTSVNVNGDRMVVDTNLGVTWADISTPLVSYPGGPGYPSFQTSSVSFSGALQWIDFLNTSNYGGYSDWRLPSDNGAGYVNMVYPNLSRSPLVCPDRDNELACLFIKSLGNTYGQGGTNFGPFQSLSADRYWGITQNWSWNWNVSTTDSCWAYKASSNQQSYIPFELSEISCAAGLPQGRYSASVVGIRTGLVSIPVSEPEVAFPFGAVLFAFLFVRNHKTLCLLRQ